MPDVECRRACVGGGVAAGEEERVNAVGLEGGLLGRVGCAKAQRVLEVSRWVWGRGDVEKVVGVGKCLLPGGAIWVGWGVEHEQGCVVELRKEHVNGRLALRRVGVGVVGTGAVVGWSRCRRAGSGSLRDAVFAGSQA